MANLEWGDTKNLEYSIIQFLREAANLEGLNLRFRPEKEMDKTWQLPTVQVYYFSKVPGRLEIGSNIRFDCFIMMIDIRCDEDTQPVDVADWVEKTLNDGCPFYQFSPNPSDPMNPYKILAGNALMDVFTSLPVNLGDDVDLYDKYRHRMTLKFWLTK